MAELGSKAHFDREAVQISPWSRSLRLNARISELFFSHTGTGHLSVDSERDLDRASIASVVVVLGASIANKSLRSM